MGSSSLTGTTREVPRSAHPLPPGPVCLCRVAAAQDDLQVLLAKHPGLWLGREQLLQLSLCTAVGPVSRTRGRKGHCMCPCLKAQCSRASPAHPILGIHLPSPARWISLQALLPQSVSVRGYWLIDWVFVPSAPKAVRKVPTHLSEGEI